MKIALLNLQYDNNYGGNLQRYALMTVLQRMGHEVTHLNLRSNFIRDPLYKRVYHYLRRLKHKMFNHYKGSLIPDYRAQQAYLDRCKKTDVFYDRYVKHTKPIFNKSDLKKYDYFDAYIVGSDQVWRKEYASHHGLTTFFFDFLPSDCCVRRIAYGVSFGIDENVLTEEELGLLTPLYEKFHAVSVREDGALTLLQKYNWNNPEAYLVLDPTLLLCKEDYIRLFQEGQTQKSQGDLFCYILDWSDEKQTTIESVQRKYGFQPYFVTNNDENVSVEQWVRSFYDAKYVVTDSYHGVLFSVIFNKPFTLVRNKERGNSRFSSLYNNILGNDMVSNYNWDRINANIEELKLISTNFLSKALE
jgi:hypothetical protein